VKILIAALFAVLVWATAAPAPIIRVEQAPPPGGDNAGVIVTRPAKTTPDPTMATWLLLKVLVGPVKE